MTTDFIITGFHPLTVTLPPGETVEGKVRIVLPLIHVQIYDLSMGIDLLKGAHIGSDVSCFGVNVEFTEPVKISKVMEFILACQETLEQAWQLAQREFDKKGALL